MRPGRPLRSMARLALGGVLLTGQALAQAKPAKPAPPTLSELQEAGRQSEAGARAFTMGVYEAALPHFQKAYALGHKPADLQKVAESYRALGQNGAAYEAYTRLLATHGPALGFAGAIAVKKAIAELEATTGTMDVRSTPDGAVVRVGDLVLGVTPLSAPARLSAGATHVEVSKDGFEPFVTDVAIDPTHPATVDATLVARALTGHLAVTESHAAKADLLIDGQDVGPLPWEGDVPPGIHQLSIQATDLKAEPQTLKVVRGTRIDATFNADFITGALKVTAHPGSADIALDGKSIGTGTFEGRVAVGDHVLRVTAAGYKPVEKPVTIAGETPAASDVSLEREITPAEIAAAMAARDAEAIRGFYGQLTAFGTWPPVSTHIGCGDTSAPQGGNAESCSSGFAYGAGGTLRAGYSFGILGLEVVGGFMYGSWQDSVTYASSTGNQAPPSNPTIGSFAHNESYSLVYTGSMAAVGPRLMTAGRTFRLSFGVAGGVSFRNIQLTRSMSGGLTESPSYSGSVLAVSPGALADLGFIWGSTPGVSFVFGAMAWAELPSQTQVSPQTVQETPSGGAPFSATSGPFTVLSGPQLYVGPYIGIRLGH